MFGIEIEARKRRAGSYPTGVHDLKRRRLSIAEFQGSQGVNGAEQHGNVTTSTVKKVMDITNEVHAASSREASSRATMVTIAQPTSPLSVHIYTPQQVSEAIDRVLGRHGLTRVDPVEEHKQRIARRRDKQKEVEEFEEGEGSGARIPAEDVIDREDANHMDLAECRKKPQGEPLFTPATPTADDSDEAIAQFALGQAAGVTRNPLKEAFSSAMIDAIDNSDGKSSATPQLREVTVKDIKEVQSFGERNRGGPPTADNAGRLWLHEELRFFRKRVFRFGEGHWDSIQKAMNYQFRDVHTWSIPLMKHRWAVENSAMIAVLEQWKIEKKSHRPARENTGEPSTPNDNNAHDLATIAEPSLIRWVRIFGAETRGEWSEEKHCHWYKAARYLRHKFEQLGKALPDAFCDRNGDIDPESIWRHWVLLHEKLINAPVLDVEDPDLHNMDW